MIPVYSNSLGDEELAAVKHVFESRWLGKGKECASLEKELGAFWHTDHVLLTNCCTAALYIAARAAGIGPGDEVIISSMNFLACANAVVDLGAKPVFADIDERYLSIIPEEIDRLKTSRTKALFLLHYGGHPADFDRIRDACGDKIAIIEDSANSVASTYKGNYCGTLGHMGAFSFDAMKTLVMGDGGALVVRDKEIFDRAMTLRYLGFSETVTSGYSSLGEGKNRWWEFELDATSGRFISNDILASVGRVQLRRLPDFLKRRKEVWETYQRELADIEGLVLPPDPRPDTTGSYYIYWLRVPNRRDELAQHLVDKGVYATMRYHPLHLVSHYGADQRLPNAELASQEILNIPLHQNLSDDDLGCIVDAVRSFFR